MRLTEVQQPKTAATLSTSSSCLAFSANSGQSEAGSTTTASSFLPSRPPFLFCSSISISMTSFSVVSLIAMVPESECRMPTLMVSSAAMAWPAIMLAKLRAMPPSSALRSDLVIFVSLLSWQRDVALHLLHAKRLGDRTCRHPDHGRKIA